MGRKPSKEELHDLFEMFDGDGNGEKKLVSGVRGSRIPAFGGFSCACVYTYMQTCRHCTGTDIYIHTYIESI
jgi:hypothetical protein